MIIFIDDVGYNKILEGTKRGISLRFISTFQLKKSLKKDCKLYVVIAMNSKDDTVDASQHPILSKFGDVFLEEFPGLSPKRELEFAIELKPWTKPISRAPYHMTTP